LSFKQLLGFSDQEIGYDGAKRRLRQEGSAITSTENEKRYDAGHLKVVSLTELRTRVEGTEGNGPNSFQNISEDVRVLLQNRSYAGALFQVASQFNLLEMGDPALRPENGVEIYWSDHSQGPACARTAIGATLFRNYFIPLNGTFGQTRDNQLNCLKRVLTWIKNKSPFQWKFRNGYIFISQKDAEIVNRVLEQATETEREFLKGELEVGLQWNVQINDDSKPLDQYVSQIFCSAFPIGYHSRTSSAVLQPLAELILEAAYEATMLAAVINSIDNENHDLVLTKLGGGYFENPEQWIARAIQRALDALPNRSIRVSLNNFRQTERCFTEIHVRD